MVGAHIGSVAGKKLKYELDTLTRHAVVLGTTGSGKTVMGKVLIEEALASGISVIAIDPKGDLGGLAVTSDDFDFRPFVSGGKKSAEKAANLYSDAVKNQEIDKNLIKKLAKVDSKIYTPKSNAGLSISLMPDLSAPKGFSKLSSDDPTIIADFVEPVSASIVQLAGIKGGNAEKMQSFLSSLLINSWNAGSDLDIEGLIKQVIEPPIETIGSLPLDDFINEKERKKLAASLNLILSSPAKQAWKKGERMNMDSMLSSSRLSVIDLRFAINMEEKQFVVEQILSELYKFLIRKGGSQRLKYILYIDELAGLLPPPPANPPTKKLLELLIRQARAFGLGIIVATQNPGDIDYRIFGNIGTRFIGRLRTERDIEKVATAMDLLPSRLKTDISTFSVGDFMYHNAVKNSARIMKARWLLTYHAGPLKENEIGWVNDPSKRPAMDGKLTLKTKTEKITSVKNKTRKAQKKKTISARTLLQAEPKARKRPKKAAVMKRPTSKTKTTLSPIIKVVKRYSDKVQLKSSTTPCTEYVPHLRIVIEPKPIRHLALQMQGPFVFDLTGKVFPVGNYLKQISWSTYVDGSITIAKHRRNIKATYDFALKEARQSLRSKIFKSTILSFQSFERDEVEQKNHTYLTAEWLRPRIRQLEDKENKEIKAQNTMMKKNKDKIGKLSFRKNSDKAKRILKRVFTKKKVAKVTIEMKTIARRIKQFQKENYLIKKRIKKIKELYGKRRQALRDQAFLRSHSSVRQRSYNPKRDDLIVHTTILLVPKRGSEI